MVLCLFTGHDVDWSYCMWECGLATDPTGASTHVIILQLTDRFPAPFQDRVRVDVRERANVETFVSGFLTDPDFFPGSGGPLTPLAPGSEIVKRQSDQLFESLEPLCPQESAEWRPWPVLILEFATRAIDDLPDSQSQSERIYAVHDLLMDDCFAVDPARTAPNLFGIGHFEKRHPFRRIVEAWSRTHRSSKSDWIGSVARQISLAALDSMPETEWVLMEGGPGVASQWSVPVLCWTRRNNTRGWVQFDIYLIPATGIDPETGRPPLGYAPKGPAEGPLGPLPPSETAAQWEAELS